jgi:hypothetical protein
MNAHWRLPLISVPDRSAMNYPQHGGPRTVSTHIQSGKYKTTGPDGPNCYYARLKTGDGSVGGILDNNNSQGPVTVTIKESDGYFETQGCADWMKVDR